MGRSVPDHVRRYPCALPSDPGMSPSLTPMAAAGFMSCSLPTVYRKLKSGTWPGFMIGGQLRIPTGALRAIQSKKELQHA